MMGKAEMKKKLYFLFCLKIYILKKIKLIEFWNKICNKEKCLSIKIPVFLTPYPWNLLNIYDPDFCSIHCSWGEGKIEYTGSICQIKHNTCD